MMIHQCAVCHAIEGPPLYWRDHERLEPGSHGYCPVHYEAAMKSIRYSRARRETDAALVSYTKARDAA